MSSDKKETKKEEEPKKVVEEEPLEEGRLFCGSVNVHYAKAGHGPHNLLFLHDALCFYNRDFTRHLKGFDQDKFTLVAWDAPGYGKSRPPDRDHTAGYLARDAESAFELMDQLGLLPFSVLGQGEGAQVAMHMAHQQRNSGNINRMVLWGTSAYVSEKGFKAFDSLVRDTTLWAEHKKQPFLDQYGEEYFQRAIDAYFDSRKAIYQDKKLRGNICKEILKEIPQATLLIYPEFDFYYDEEEMDDLEEWLPNSGLLFAEEMYHNLHMLNYDWFKRTCERFLNAETDHQFDIVEEERKRMEAEYYAEKPKDEEDPYGM